MSRPDADDGTGGENGMGRQSGNRSNGEQTDEQAHSRDEGSPTDSEHRPGSNGDDNISGEDDLDSARTSPGRSQRLLEWSETDRWKGLAGIALAVGGIGLIGRYPPLLLAAAVPVGVLWFLERSARSEPHLSVDRTFDPQQPEEGETVEVTVTIENAGERTLPDCRFVDRIPDGLVVVDGRARDVVTLRPGESATVTYAVTARRGRHEFDGLVATVRGFAAATVSKYEIDVPDVLDVPPTFESIRGMSLRSLTTPYTGRVRTDESGAGLEFHTVREYQPGDPLKRIDWNRRARDGDLATLEFRTERAASVVLVADVRATAHVRPGRGEQSGADRGIDAICRLFPTLLEQGNQVGIATFGPDCRWLPPGSGAEHRTRARELLATDPLFAPRSSDRSLPARLHARRLRRYLSGSDQVVVCSPLCDDDAERTIRMIDAYDHHPTVVSPDPTTGGTPGRRLARAERSLRIARLRRLGVRVVDWSSEESLDKAIARAQRRWSR